MVAPDRENLLRAIADTKQRIADLEKQQQDAEADLRSLQDCLEQYGSESTASSTRSEKISADPPQTLTPDEKIALFTRLFKGRTDVNPKLWENRKSEKKGYSPACANEWIRGVCNKPRVKCGECTNQAFLPVTADTVRDHLQGRHVIGVYPMLSDGYERPAQLLA